MHMKIIKSIYEGLMVLLVMLTIMTIWSEQTYNSTINWIVWIIFVVDFIVRLYLTQEKWSFIKSNPFLLIAIIPFDQFFQLARLVRVIYLFRLKTITKYYISPYIEKLTYKSTIFLITILFAFLFIESYFVWIAERSIPSYLSAMYVTFGHLLVFGNQLFEIEKQWIVWSLTGTSIIGLIVQGVALQWAFTKIERYIPRKKDTRNNQSS